MVDVLIETALNMSSYREKTRIAELLKRHIAENNLTIEALTVRLDASRASVQGWIKAMVYPGLESRQKIAQELGMTVEELDSEVSGVPLKQARSTSQIIQDIRLMSIDDFKKVLQACCDRAINELTK